jgi:putative ATP-binding cassette transporter
VRATNRRQGLEADFRFGLVQIRENAQSIALLHAESEERARLGKLLTGVRGGWRRQTGAWSDVMIFSAGYSVLSTAFPILIAAPRYISGAITLGVLMQTAQAFQQTVAALSWPIDNLGRYADLKASAERVLGLREALGRLDRQVAEDNANGQRIIVDRTDQESTLSFREVTICEPDGRPFIAPFDAEILPGQRVLIVGDPGAGVRLFRAVARVWPWGHGRIGLPAHTRVFFMPQRPFQPTGTLRKILAYPGDVERVDDAAARTVLQKVGLSYLVSRLGDNDNWAEVLTTGEQQRLGFARLLLRRPDWIFMEQATDALDPTGEEDLLRLLDEELPNATRLTVGNHPGLEHRHNRKFVLERTNDIVTMREVPCHSFDIAPSGVPQT